MGTDIHGVFQRRGDDGKWHDVPTEYDEPRHYQLFAVLAGVRNGYGFAGVRTGEPVQPVAKPRGLPDDFEVEGDDSQSHPVPSVEHLGWRAKYRREDEPLVVWMGYYGHSWLTADEMLAWFAAAPTVIREGVVERSVYEAWDKNGQPPEYSGDVMGLGVVKVNDSAIEMAATPDWTHVRCTWDSSLRSDLAYFFDEVARLKNEHGEVRFVFGFDS